MLRSSFILKIKQGLGTVKPSSRGQLNHRNNFTVTVTKPIHTTRPQCVNPLILTFVARRIGKIGAMLVGRGIRKWWQSLPKEKKTLLIHHFKKHKWKYIGSSTLVGGASYTFLETHLTKTPYTNRKRLMFFDSSQIEQMGVLSFDWDIQEFKEKMLPQNHPKVHRVKRVCQRLLRGNKNIPQLSKFWTVCVIDMPLENCHVYPSGQIVIYSGMLNLCDNDDELAVVLSHELSHVILEHSAELLSYASLVDMLVLVPLAVIWAFLPNDAIAAVTHWFFNRMVEIFATLPFNRSLEDEADSLGIFLSANSCFDVRVASAFWGKLDIIDKETDRTPDAIKYLSTHPSHTDRQSHLEQLMTSAIEIREALRCPKLNKLDPRISVKILQEHIKEKDSKILQEGIKEGYSKIPQEK